MLRFIKWKKAYPFEYYIVNNFKLKLGKGKREKGSRNYEEGNEGLIEQGNIENEK